MSNDNYKIIPYNPSYYESFKKLSESFPELPSNYIYHTQEIFEYLYKGFGHNDSSSLIIINGSTINKTISGKKIKIKINKIIIFICFFVFLLASKGYSILYLFLLADLLCCAAVITIFNGFFNKKINLRLAYSSIVTGLMCGLLFFPSTSFQSSILVGNLIPKDQFNPLITTNLLFISFIISIIVPLMMTLVYSLRNSFK